jgi:3D (Asp-Asp-Asp) domain-containing protein
LTFYAEKYVKGLFGIRRVEGAFQRLDKLTQEEARMAEVETLTIASRIDENVIHMGANVIRMDENVIRMEENVIRMDETVVCMDETVICVDENVIRVDENVIRVGENVEVVNEGVQSIHMIVTGIDDKLESTHADVQGVHREVSLINTGDFFSSLAPESVLNLTRLGVTAAREEIKEELQVVLKCVSDLNRS